MPNRTLILRERTVKMADMAQGVDQRTFDKADGIWVLLPEVLGVLREWLGIREWQGTH